MRPRREKARCHQRLNEPRRQVSTGSAGQCHAWEAPAQPARGRLPVGKEAGGKDSQSPKSVPSLASLESEEKWCDPFKKHSERGGVEGSPVRFEKGKFLLGDSPQPEAEFLQPAGPLLHPVGVRGCRSPCRCPAPLSILPSSWDRKVSVALTRPLDLRSCSQNNPLASPASFKAGGVFQIGLVLQTQGVAGGARTGSGELSVGSWGN